MKTILVFVTTLDGKITRWYDPFVKVWSSKEDQEYFSKVWYDAKLIVMGSNSFNADPIKPSQNHLVVVMTHKPDEYEQYKVPGQIEFSDETPVKLVSRFEGAGYDKLLVAGGAQVATSFLKEQLIDELWLTFEPRVFGIGGNFVVEEKLDVNLRLLNVERVNELGTIITKYAVLKSKNPKTEV